MKKNLLFLCVMFLMLVLTGCKPSDEETLQSYLDKITVEAEVSADFYLPRTVEGKEEHTIEWTSSDVKAIKVGNLAEIDGKQCYAAKVTVAKEDKQVVLKATLEMANGLSMEKEFNVIVKGNPNLDIFTEWPYEEGKAYKFTLKHTNPKINKDLYFTGEMAGFYMATSEYSGDGVDVFCEKVEGGYKLYFKNGEVKNYLAIEKSKDGKHTNAVFGPDKNCVFTWKADYQTMVVKVGELDAYFGTDAAKTFTTIGVRTGLKVEESCVVTLQTPEIVPNPNPNPEPQPQPDDKDWGVVETFEAGKAYKLGLLQTVKNQTLYITGEINENTPWYLPSTSDKEAAADVTAVKVEGGYNLKVEGAKGVKYINAKQDGTHYSIFLEDAATSAWRYDDTNHTFITTCGDKEVFIGTHDTYTSFSCNTIDKIQTSMVAHFYGKVDGTKPEPQPEPQPTEWPYEAGKAYKFTLVHTNPAVTDKTVYFTGEMTGFYMATSANVTEGVDVFCEKVEGGYKLYFMNGEVKNYLAIEKATGGDGKEHANAVFGADKNSVFTWDSTLGTMVTKIGEKNYYFGTRADKTYTTIGTSSNTTAGEQCVVTLTEAGNTPAPEPQPEPKPQIGEWPYETNKAYKFTMVHTNPGVNKTYYFTGKMAGFYLATSTWAIQGADVYCEQVEGGYKLYFMDGETKNYLGIQMSPDGKHINAKFGADIASVFVWDTGLKTMITKVGEKYCYFGTDATKTYGTIGGSDDFNAGASCVVTLTTPELVPVPTVKENLINVDTLGVAGQGYGNGTAKINGIDYAYEEICDTGKGVQMRSKNGKSSVIKNTTAYATAIKEIKFDLNKEAIYKDITGALTIELLDENGTVLETLKLDFTKAQAEYTLTATVDAKFFKLSHTCNNALYANSILIVNKPAA